MSLEDFGFGVGQGQADEDGDDDREKIQDSRSDRLDEDRSGDECDDCGESKPSVHTRSPYEDVQLCGSCYLSREGIQR